MPIGRILILAGLSLVALGLLFLAFPRLGRLPGDLVWRGRNTAVYFPLATCLILSLVLSLISWFLRRR